MNQSNLNTTTRHYSDKSKTYSIERCDIMQLTRFSQKVQMQLWCHQLWFQGSNLPQKH